MFVLMVLKCEGKSGIHKPSYSEREIGSPPNVGRVSDVNGFSDLSADLEELVY